MLLLWMFQRFGRSRRWLVDWSSLSTDPGGWRREEIEIAFRCCPVHARRDRRQNSRQQIACPRQTRREIRDQIRLQRIQSRVPPAQRNQSGIDPFILIQGKILGPVYANLVRVSWPYSFVCFPLFCIGWRVDHWSPSTSAGCRWEADPNCPALNGISFKSLLLYTLQKEILFFFFFLFFSKQNLLKFSKDPFLCGHIAALKTQKNNTQTHTKLIHFYLSSESHIFLFFVVEGLLEWWFSCFLVLPHPHALHCTMAPSKKDKKFFPGFLLLLCWHFQNLFFPLKFVNSFIFTARIHTQHMA